MALSKRRSDLFKGSKLSFFKDYPDEYLKKVIQEALEDDGPEYDPQQIRRELLAKIKPVYK